MDTTVDKAELLEQLDRAAEIARTDLAELVGKFPEASREFGQWTAKHKNAAGYKRLAKLLAALA